VLLLRRRALKNDLAAAVPRTRRTAAVINAAVGAF